IAYGRLDPRVLRRVGESLIHFSQESELGPLQAVRVARHDVRYWLRSIRVNDRGLVPGRQKSVAEQSHSSVRRNRSPALEHHETRKIFVLRTEPVINPGSGARMAHHRKACVEKII